MGTFERVLWRVLRGNLYMNVRRALPRPPPPPCALPLANSLPARPQSAEIDDSVLPVPSAQRGDSSGGGDGDDDKRLRKNAFIIFAHGQDLLDKIRKIAECASSPVLCSRSRTSPGCARLTRPGWMRAAMGATLFSIDSSSDKRSDKLREVTTRIEDLASVLYNTNQTRRAELVKIADSISAWWALVRKEKVVFATLNLWQWDQGRKTLVAEGWVPTRDIPAVQAALRRASVRPRSLSLSLYLPSSLAPSLTASSPCPQENAGTAVSALLHELRTTKTPPTFHRTNKFTEGFQSIIDAYGIGSYQEVNPGLFTVITFPFLFGASRSSAVFFGLDLCAVAVHELIHARTVLAAVMFGDIGHGCLMTGSALTLILLEKKFTKGTGNEVRRRAPSLPGSSLSVLDAVS